MVQQEKSHNDKCIICESETMVIFSRKSKFLKLPTFICKNCGLVRTDPEMADKEYAQFYRTDAYVRLKYPTVEKYYQEKIGAQNSRAEQSFSFISEFLNDGSKVLDVGCGFGILARLINARTKKASIVGLEPSLGVSAYADRLSQESRVNIVNASFDEYYSGEPERNEMDLIIMSHVLEHLSEPLDSLKKARTLLKDTGFLYLEVPNIMNYSGSIHDFFQVCHPYNFSPHTINLLLGKSGFKLVKLSIGKEIRMLATPKVNSIDCYVDNSAFEVNNNYDRIVRRIRLNELKYNLLSNIKALALKIINKN